MWSALHISPRVDTEFASSVKELLISTSRSLIFAVGAVYAVLVYATAIWPEQLAIEIWLILPVIGVVCLVAIKLLPSHFVIAHTVWQVGLAIAIRRVLKSPMMPFSNQYSSTMVNASQPKKRMPTSGKRLGKITPTAAGRLHNGAIGTGGSRTASSVEACPSSTRVCSLTGANGSGQCTILQFGNACRSLFTPSTVT